MGEADEHYRTLSWVLQQQRSNRAKLTVDATEADKHYLIQKISQHVALVPQKPTQGHRPAKF